MTLLWFDIMTPKEVWLFGSIQEHLKEKGYEILVTTRDHDKNISLLELRGIRYIPIGKHGGGTLEGKLKASLDRSQKITDYILSLSNRPDVSISLCSVEAIRVAFGLGIPIVCFDDAPHATAVNKLVIPLSNFIISPICIPKQKFIEFGASEQNIIQFEGIDEVAWLTDFVPDEKILAELGINKNQPLIVMRPKESQAAYLLDDSKRENQLDATFKLISTILKKYDKAQIVVFTRYPAQYKLLHEKFQDRIILPTIAINGPNLMSFADVVISGGATMEREAALLGIPAISYFPISLDIETFLKNKGFPIWHLKKYDNVLDLVLKILENPEKYKKDTSSLLKELENPKTVIEKLLIKSKIIP
ncbi:MAG: DUF354 domain-containing protein [Candidatus Helarchaeota archaeon]